MSAPVLTGVGAVTAFGQGVEALWSGLSAGDRAIRPLHHFPTEGFPVQVGGAVPDAVRPLEALRAAYGQQAALEALATDGSLRDRKIAWGLLAAHEAWTMAGQPTGLRLSVALGLECAFLEDFVPMFHRDQAGVEALDWAQDQGPACRYRSPVDRTATLLRAMLPIVGAPLVNASACAAGGLALATAAAWIRRGEATAVLCGGADSMLNPLGLAGLARLGVPSPRAELDACRPFDPRRDGIVVGEGAAFFIVEAESHARARGAPILGRLLGEASTQDGYRPTAPREDGHQARQAMSLALRRARLAPADVGYINAHGTGTPSNDLAEARAIFDLFGPEAPLTGSIKGALGHGMAAAGAIEAAACLLPLLRGVVPGTAGHEVSDPDLPIAVLGERPHLASPAVVLSNSFGFGGQNVTLLFGSAREPRP
jgi:3-oxoacyl-[acyl-carrier-protein] synthase II